MPTYGYVCDRCEVEIIVMHGMNETLDASERCPSCGGKKFTKAINAPRIRVPDSGWEYENNGRGRFITQIAKKTPCGNGYDENDPNAFCRSQREAIDKARAQGKNVERII